MIGDILYRRIPKNKEYLYHYTSLSSFIKIIEGMSLRFNHYKNMNDPKESKYWSCSLKHEEYKKYIENTKLEEKRNNLTTYSNFNDEKIKYFHTMKSKIQVLSFTIDNPKYSFGKDEDNAYLYRGFGNPYMWSHYGNAQKGICLQLDKNLLIEKFNNLDVEHKFIPKQILYNNELHEGNPQFIYFKEILNKSIENLVKDCILENYDHYLFSKTKFWKPEREFRFAVYSNSENFVFIDIKDCISSIIIGEDIEKSDEDLILNIGEQHRISIAKISWGNGYPTARTLNNYKANYIYD